MTDERMCMFLPAYVFQLIGIVRWEKERKTDTFEQKYA